MTDAWIGVALRDGGNKWEEIILDMLKADKHIVHIGQPAEKLVKPTTQSRASQSASQPSTPVEEPKSQPAEPPKGASAQLP